MCYIRSKNVDHCKPYVGILNNLLDAQSGSARYDGLYLPSFAVHCIEGASSVSLHTDTTIIRVVYKKNTRRSKYGTKVCYPILVVKSGFWKRLGELRRRCLMIKILKLKPI